MYDDNTQGLGAAIDAWNEAEFFGHQTSERERLELGRLIASYQGKPGAYRGMFAPSEADRAGIWTFTGESIESRAGVAHILSEECMRTLALLNLADPEVERAFLRARSAALEFLGASPPPGFFCCGRCSVSLLRAAAANAYGDRDARVRSGVESIRAWREAGRWRRYPFFYTLLALSEIDSPEAKEELLYVKPSCERSLASIRGSGKYAERKKALLNRVITG